MLTLSYPTRLAKAKSDSRLDKFIDMFKVVKINIPLLDALRDMPVCAKFLKDTLARKRKFSKFERVNLSEKCSAVV